MINQTLCEQFIDFAHQQCSIGDKYSVNLTNIVITTGKRRSDHKLTCSTKHDRTQCCGRSNQTSVQIEPTLHTSSRRSVLYNCNKMPLSIRNKWPSYGRS